MLLKFGFHRSLEFLTNCVPIELSSSLGHSLFLKGTWNISTHVSAPYEITFGLFADLYGTRNECYNSRDYLFVIHKNSLPSTILAVLRISELVSALAYSNIYNLYA